MNLEDIIKGCKKNNAGAQEQLYRLYKDVLYTISLKYCKNEEEAQDNLHNAFIDIFTSIDKFKNTGSFEGWIKRITINKAIDSYRKALQLVPIKDDVSDTDVTDTEMDVPASEILAMIQELPNQYRLIFSLYELDNHSHKEIAEMLGISENTSKSNLHRAKAILKEKLRTKHSFRNYNVSNGE